MNGKFDKEMARMKRIEGQARGIARMMDEGRYCIEILQQMNAMEAAIRAAKSRVLSIHAGHCVEEALNSGNIDDQREKFTELVDLFARAGR